MFRKVIAVFCENKRGHITRFCGLLTAGASYTSQVYLHGVFDLSVFYGCNSEE